MDIGRSGGAVVRSVARRVARVVRCVARWYGTDTRLYRYIAVAITDHTYQRELLRHRGLGLLAVREQLAVGLTGLLRLAL